MYQACSSFRQLHLPFDQFVGSCEHKGGHGYDSTSALMSWQIQCTREGEKIKSRLSQRKAEIYHLFVIISSVLWILGFRNKLSQYFVFSNFHFWVWVMFTPFLLEYTVVQWHAFSLIEETLDSCFPESVATFTSETEGWYLSARGSTRVWSRPGYGVDHKLLYI